MRVRLNRKTEGSSQTKVCKFNDSVLVNEEVLGLEITMQNTMRVAVENALEDLVEIGLRKGEEETK